MSQRSLERRVERLEDLSVGEQARLAESAHRLGVVDLAGWLDWFPAGERRVLAVNLVRTIARLEDNEPMEIVLQYLRWLIQS